MNVQIYRAPSEDSHESEDSVVSPTMTKQSTVTGGHDSVFDTRTLGGPVALEQHRSASTVTKIQRPETTKTFVEKFRSLSCFLQIEFHRFLLTQIPVG